MSPEAGGPPLPTPLQLVQFPLVAQLVLVVPVHTHAAAATYGPTSGPPPGAPTGVTALVPVSANARARFNRPLPV